MNVLRFTVFLCTLILIQLVPGAAEIEPVFDDYFVGRTMRVDYYHIGDAKEENITLDQVYEQGSWAGSTVNLIDSFNLGRYYVKVYDSESGKLIFSRGFDSFFGEYKTTGPALKGIERTYHESALVPFPKRTVKFTIEKKDRKNRFYPFFSCEIDPQSISIIRENPTGDVKIIKAHRAGPSRKKVDLVFIGEGYTVEEEEKFRKDLERAVKAFFSLEPYGSMKECFNITGVFRSSAESGCDEPNARIFKNTAVSASFNAFGSPRYLLVEENKSFRDIAAHVPYDALIIMVNHKRYGGGGIYNLYCVFTADNPAYEYLLLHEFGHSFSCLADEYYTSSVAYNEFYPIGVEPVEANITALLDKKNLKWKEMVTQGTALPTLWDKERYDRMDCEYQKMRAQLNANIRQLKNEGASAESVAEAEQELEAFKEAHRKKMDDFFTMSPFAGKVGAFEGAGYSSEGFFRPMLDCLMFSVGKKPYCKVCEQAVRHMILYYCE